MKASTRKIWKKLNWHGYITHDLSLIAAADSDPARQAVIQAYKKPQAAKELLQTMLKLYQEYKDKNYDYPTSKLEPTPEPSLEPNIIGKQKYKELLPLKNFLPEVYLDFIFQSLKDYLNGEKLETAFGLSPESGRPSSVDELQVAKFFHKAKNDGGYEHAISETIEHFGLGEKRIKMIYSNYSQLTGFEEIVNFDLSVKTLKL